MIDGNDKGTKRLGVFAVFDKEADGTKKYWPKLGVAFVNRDGSMTLILDGLPIGTNRLQVRELREDARPGANGGARRNGFEVLEVRP